MPRLRFSRSQSKKKTHYADDFVIVNEISEKRPSFREWVSCCRSSSATRRTAFDGEDSESDNSLLMTETMALASTAKPQKSRSWTNAAVSLSAEYDVMDFSCEARLPTGSYAAEPLKVRETTHGTEVSFLDDISINSNDDEICRPEPNPMDVRALERCEAALEEGGLSNVDAVNVLYTMGRLSSRMGNYEQALTYHQAELEISEMMVEDGLGNDDAVARVLDGMARVADEGMGDRELARDYYKTALKVRLNLHTRAMKECHSCKECKSPSQPCAKHLPILRETSSAVQDTKRNIGRLLFEDGEVGQAIDMIPRIGNVANKERVFGMS